MPFVKRGGDKLSEADEILRRYWGATGADKALDTAAIRALKLSADQLDALEDRLPPKGSGGATGQRVDECYRLLDRLQAARA